MCASYIFVFLLSSRGEDPKPFNMLWCGLTSCFGVSLGRSALVYAFSSQQPGLACSPSNFGVGISRASGAVFGHVLVFLGSREEHKLALCFESRFLGCPLGLRPCRFWLELSIPCLALGSLMILVQVYRFILGIERRATFLTCCTFTFRLEAINLERE